MEIFIASRLTSGNRIFPARLVIDELGVTLKIPGLFSGNETTIPYSRISSVDIDCPFIGFSTIIIATTGDGNIRAHGYMSSEVRKMKELILKHIHAV
jgi:hypothetical protein